MGFNSGFKGLIQKFHGFRYVIHSLQWDTLSFTKPASSNAVRVIYMLCLLQHVSTFLRRHQELYCKGFRNFKMFIYFFLQCLVFATYWTQLLTFWHWSFTFNSNKSPTWCNSFSVYYPDVCLQINMFWAFSRPSSGAQWMQCSKILMMGGKTPETCWAANKRQDNKLKNCCIRLVIYLNCTMMHGLTNLKFCN